MELKDKTRLTIIFEGKRIFEEYDVTIKGIEQDDNRTLKLFVDKQK